MDPQRDPWPSVEEAPEREQCELCEALDSEPHQPTCPLYLPLCPVCGHPTKHDGEVCGKCRLAVQPAADDAGNRSAA